MLKIMKNMEMMYLYIRKRKIRNPQAYLESFQEGTSICIGIQDITNQYDNLQKCGFSNELAVGEQIIPAPIFRTESKFNAEGKLLKRRDLPMETAHRLQEWNLTDWNGVEHSGIAYVPYQRFPREFISPPLNEITILENEQENKVIVSNLVIKNDANMSAIKNIINLFLEIFGECYVLTDTLVPQIRVNVRRLQWEFLPPGRYPWERLQVHIDSAFENIRRNRRAIMSRFETINNYNPDLVAVGRAGFKGYVAFSFSDKNIHILESVYSDNATYVFDNGWEALTQLAKSEILNGNLHLQRIVHRPDWEEQIQNLLR